MREGGAHETLYRAVSLYGQLGGVLFHVYSISPLCYFLFKFSSTLKIFAYRGGGGLYACMLKQRPV